MSGGSFNYLFREADSSAGLASRADDINDMANFLEKNGFHKEAEDTLNVLGKANEAVEAAQALEKVWKAVEWERSGDSNIDGVLNAIADYRANKLIVDARSSRQTKA